MKDIYEKFRIINKTNLTVSDIAKLMDCGLTKASNYRRKFIIRKGLVKDDVHISYDINTADFLEFYKIDVNLIRENFKLLYQMDNNGGLADAKRI